jgi:hypothetical protein
MSVNRIDAHQKTQTHCALLLEGRRDDIKMIRNVNMSRKNIKADNTHSQSVENRLGVAVPCILPHHRPILACLLQKRGVFHNEKSFVRCVIWR